MARQYRTDVRAFVVLVLFLVTVRADYCGDYDIRNFTPRIGSSNDSPALQAANAADIPYIYADRFTSASKLAIGTSVTLNKPLVIGRYLALDIGSSATLTLAAQPIWPKFGVVRGSARVSFSGPGPYWVLPEWWRPSGAVSDWSPILEAIAAACGGSQCVVVLSGSYALSRPLQLSPALRVWGAPGSKVQPASGSNPAGAFFFQSGAYAAASAQSLPAISGFAGYGVTLDRTTGLGLYVPAIGSGGDGVVFNAGSGSVQQSSATVFMTSKLLNAAVFAATSSAASFTNTLYYSGFYVNAPAAGASSAVLFRGAAPRLSNAAAAFSALDSHQQSADFAILRSAVAAPISNFALSIPSWAGGWGPATRLLRGAYNSLRAVIKVAAAQRTPVVAVSGADLQVDWTAWARDSAVSLTTSTTRPASLPGANYMVATLSPSLFTGTWKAGAKRSFYVYSVLATGALKQLVASPGVLSQRTDFVVNPGIVVSRIVDEGAKAPNRIRVDLTNVLGRAITVKDVTLPNGKTYALYWTIYLGVPGLVA